MDNRQRILECAFELFCQRGYDAVGIQEICNEAGITKPTMYHYFGSKTGLLRTLMEDKMSEVMEKLEEAAVFHGDMEQALYDFATVLTDFANADHKGYMLLMSMCYSPKESEVHQVGNPYIVRIYNMVVQLFEQAAYVLGNMNGRQKEFAIGFMGLVNHYILYLCFMDEGPVEISEEKKRGLIHQFMHGIYS